MAKTEKTEKYRALMRRQLDLQTQEAALLDDMDALWYSMSPEETEEFTVLRCEKCRKNYKPVDGPHKCVDG